MPRSDRKVIPLRIVIEQPVAGVLHSLQGKDGTPLAPCSSQSDESLAFHFAIDIEPGPKFFGDQVRREGPLRRFVYIRVGEYAGDPTSPWARRMKIDIHDLDEGLLDTAVAENGIVEIVVIGTLADGSPACGTVRPIRRQLAEQRTSA